MLFILGVFSGVFRTVICSLLYLFFPNILLVMAAAYCLTGVLVLTQKEVTGSFFQGVKFAAGTLVGVTFVCTSLIYNIAAIVVCLISVIVLFFSWLFYHHSIKSLDGTLLAMEQKEIVKTLKETASAGTLSIIILIGITILVSHNAFMLLSVIFMIKARHYVMMAVILNRAIDNMFQKAVKMFIDQVSDMLEEKESETWKDK